MEGVGIIHRPVVTALSARRVDECRRWLGLVSECRHKARVKLVHTAWARAIQMELQHWSCSV